MDNPIPMLMNLGAVAAIAAAAILLIWRSNSHREAPSPGFILGYPPEQFPAHDVVHQEALRSLAATQSRLLSVHANLPPHSDSAKRLHAFLVELRAIMDVAYQVAVITRPYGGSAQLNRLATEVQQIETELTQQLVHRLLSYEADAQEELLKTRFESLRELVRSISPDPETQLPMLKG